MTDLMIEPLLVKVSQAAKMLSLSQSYIYEMMASGQISSVKIGGSRRIAVATIKQWIADHTVENTNA